MAWNLHVEDAIYVGAGSREIISTCYVWPNSGSIKVGVDIHQLTELPTARVVCVFFKIITVCSNSFNV